MLGRYYIMLSAKSVIQLAHDLLCQQCFGETVKAILIFLVVQPKHRSQLDTVLLPTGAKLAVSTGSHKKGSFCIYGYSHDCSDIEQYLRYGKKVVY